MGQLIRKNLVNEGWKSSELHSAIHKLSRTFLNDLQRELKADQNVLKINQKQRSNKEKKSEKAPPRPLSGPDLEARQRRPLPPPGRGPQLPEEVVKEFEDSMMDPETNIYQNVQRVTPSQNTNRNGKEVQAKTIAREKRTDADDGSILSDVSLVIDVENVSGTAQEEHLYESLENLNTLDLKTAQEVYYDSTMETATDIQEEYYIEPRPTIGRCKALFDFEGMEIVKVCDKIEYFLFAATTEENAISLFEGESLLVLESDNGDGWTRYLIID